jgi:polyisoprenyl-phosphate glycosyltransferase
MIAIRPRILLSVVIPCYNEEEALPRLLEQLTPCLEEATNGAWELILVDDGSFDRTAEIIRETHQVESRVRGVVLSRNFGHQAAIFAGLAYASGDYIGVMDADLQDPPRVLVECFRKAHEEHFDLIYAVRKRRQANPFLKLAYWGFYRLMSALAEYHWPLDAGDFSVFSRKALRLVMQLPEHVRVLRGLRSWVGLKQGSVEYDRPGRGQGDSKYNLLKLGALALNALISFSNVPLRLASVLGLGMSTLSFALGGLFLLNRLFPKFSVFGYYVGAHPGTATIVILLLIFGGLLFLCLGILGEYLAVVVKEIKRRPVAIVHHHYGIKDINPHSPLILVTQHREDF